MKYRPATSGGALGLSGAVWPTGTSTAVSTATAVLGAAPPVTVTALLVPGRQVSQRIVACVSPTACTHGPLVTPLPSHANGAAPSPASSSPSGTLVLSHAEKRAAPKHARTKPKRIEV